MLFHSLGGGTGSGFASVMATCLMFRGDVVPKDVNAGIGFVDQTPVRPRRGTRTPQRPRKRRRTD